MATRDPPAVSYADEYLRLILLELRAIRADIAEIGGRIDPDIAEVPVRKNRKRKEE